MQLGTARRRPRLISRLFAGLSTSLHSLAGFALMLAAVIPILTAGGLEGGDQSALVFTGLGGGALMLFAGQARGKTNLLVPLLVAAWVLGSSSGIAEGVREFLIDRGVALPEFDYDELTSSIEPLSLLLIYAGAALGVVASILGLFARFTRD